MSDSFDDEAEIFSETVMFAAAAIVATLRARDRSSIEQLVVVVGASAPTVHRALRYLRKLGAPMKFDRTNGRHRGWLLTDRRWKLPLFMLTRSGFVPVTPKADDQVIDGTSTSVPAGTELE
jgi:hypothetical protein